MPPTIRESWAPSFTPSTKPRSAARRHLVEHEQHRHFRCGRRVAARQSPSRALIVRSPGRHMVRSATSPSVIWSHFSAFLASHGASSGIDLHICASSRKTAPRFGRRPRAHRQRDGARVPVLLAVDDHHGLAVDVLLVARHPELVHQRLDAVLARTHPRAAAVDPRPVAADLGERATADPVTGLQQRHRVARLLEPQRRRQARRTPPQPRNNSRQP